jgi:hypothetical protein
MDFEVGEFHSTLNALRKSCRRRFAIQITCGRREPTLSWEEISLSMKVNLTVRGGLRPNLTKPIHEHEPAKVPSGLSMRLECILVVEPLGFVIELRRSDFDLADEPFA